MRKATGGQIIAVDLMIRTVETLTH